MIRFAILGMLSHRPQTGYDLKKVFVESEALYWSGNNNQIYRTLSELLEEGLVTKEIHAQEKLPAKGIYAITDKGLAELKRWLVSPPEAPEYRSTFLVRLMWADQLESPELETLLLQYEQEVHAQLLMQREKARRAEQQPGGTPRQAYLREMISENITGCYERELAWVGKVRRGLNGRENHE
ncbi:MAG TPA: PadR family transcriptional regulator [Symbiobacteriaceae bacterium]|nr:PadR family transcriptional regulator [Symbiobacteriaceae bacterium]